MTPADRSFLIRLFGVAVVFLVVALPTELVIGFVAARLMGLPTDSKLLYEFLHDPFLMLVGVLATMLGNFTRNKPDEAPPP